LILFREKPWQAIAVAAGIGFVLGLLTDRRGGIDSFSTSYHVEAAVSAPAMALTARNRSTQNGWRTARRFPEGVRQAVDRI
jgi:hypothetical protein